MHEVKRAREWRSGRCFGWPAGAWGGHTLRGSKAMSLGVCWGGRPRAFGGLHGGPHAALSASTHVLARTGDAWVGSETVRALVRNYALARAGRPLTKPKPDGMGGGGVNQEEDVGGFSPTPVHAAHRAEDAARKSASCIGGVYDGPVRSFGLAGAG